MIASLRRDRAATVTLTDYGSAFPVDGRPDLGIVVYNPATPADTDRVRSLMEAQSSG